MMDSSQVYFLGIWAQELFIRDPDEPLQHTQQLQALAHLFLLLSFPSNRKTCHRVISGIFTLVIVCNCLIRVSSQFL